MLLLHLCYFPNKYWTKEKLDIKKIIKPIF